eukprot:150276-Chlamydomonas_euryale.AAC.1
MQQPQRSATQPNATATAQRNPTQRNSHSATRCNVSNAAQQSPTALHNAAWHTAAIKPTRARGPG